MRHKVQNDDVVTEPNLTPMLDLVLQILMFFITTTQLVEKEKNHSIDLPFSQTARPLDKKVDRDYIFVTLDYDESKEPLERHEVRVIGKSKPLDFQTARVWLGRRFADKKRDAGAGDVKTKVILRASKEAEVGQVLQLFRICQDVGFTNLRIRAFKPKAS